MMRTLRRWVGAAAVLAAGAALAQQPPAPRPPTKAETPAPAKAADPAPAAAATSDYYPLKPKSKWVYKTGDQTVEVEVGAAAKDGGTTLDTKVNGKTVATEVIAVDGKGVYRTSVKGDKIEPPIKILELPVKKDASWPVDSKVGAQSVKGKFTVKSEAEKVKVPAGEFDTVLVDGPDFDIAGTKTTIRYYFAKGKGVVKLVYEIQGTKSELDLKEYVEAK